MLTRMLFIAFLTSGSAGVALAQSELETELRERENGQFELTLSHSSGEATAAELELELSASDRLQLRAEIPVSPSAADELEIGLAYDFSRRERLTLFAGLDVAVADPSDVSLRFQSEMGLGRREILSKVTVGIGESRDVALELAAGSDDSDWRGTIDLRHESGTSEWRIIPGLARKIHGVWITVGVALPSAATSTTSLVFKTGFDF